MRWSHAPPALEDLVLNIVGSRVMLPTEPDYDISLLPHFVKEAFGTRGFRGCVLFVNFMPLYDTGMLYIGSSLCGRQSPPATLARPYVKRKESPWLILGANWRLANAKSPAAIVQVHFIVVEDVVVRVVRCSKNLRGGRGGTQFVHGRSRMIVAIRPSHPCYAGTEHAGYSPTRRTLLAPIAKRREVFGE